MKKPVQRRTIYHWAIAIFITFLQGMFIYILFSGWNYDDPYITYRYAENLNRGFGFVYNPGEKVLSTTTPLFTLILYIIRYLWTDTHRLAVLIGVISLPVGGLFLWDLTYHWNRPITAWLSLLIYPIFPLLLMTLSSEMPFYLALCLGSFVFYARARYSLMAGFLALATLTRPDGILVAIIILFHYVILNRKLPPISTVIIYILILTPWFIFSSLYFGSPIPATLAAKQAQGSLGISQRFAPGILTILGWGYLTRWQYWVLALLAFVGCGSLRIQDRNFLSLLLWGCTHFIAYSLLGVIRYFWYYAPLVPAFIISSGLGIEFLLTRLVNAFPPKRLPISSLSGIIILSLFLPIATHSESQIKSTDKRFSIYRAIGEWIKTNTDEEDKIGSLEIGIIGYYAERDMVDYFGLIQPEIMQVLKLSSTYESSVIWSTHRYKPDFIVFNPEMFSKVMDEEINQNCTERFVFQGTTYEYRSNLAIYHCEWKKSKINFIVSEQFHVPKKLIAIQMEVQASFR